MKSQTRLTYLLGSIAMGLLFLAGTTASAAPCTATTCPLSAGTNGRSQIGNGLPLPITAKPAPTGQFLDAAGRVFPIAGASVNIGPNGGTTPNGPRNITIPPGVFKSGGLAKVPVFLFNSKVFQVNTSLLISNPRVGSPSPVLAAGGRTGPATITWCPGSPAPSANPLVNPGCLGPATSSGGGSTLFNGLVRFTKTKNQFGGPGTGRTLGANNGPVCTANSCNAGGARAPGTANATVYHNVNGLPGTKLPCAGGVNCQIAISVPVPITNGVFGGKFGASVVNPLGLTLNAIRTANIGANGTIISIGALVPGGGPFGNGAWPQQGLTSFGAPATTGMLTISVTGQAGPVPEVFVRTGFDGRNANGSGLLNTVGGAVSTRTFSGPNGNRTWTTYYLPEPGALVAGASALMMLGSVHWLVRRRR